MPAFLTDAEHRALDAALPAWLPRQRWFAGKEDAGAGLWAALHAVWPLSERYALGLLDTASPGAGARCYALPLGRGAASDDARHVAAGLYDAARDGAFWTDLLAALLPATPDTRAVGPFVFRLHPADGGGFRRIERALAAPVRVVEADHSNAAALVGDLFVRLTRRLDPTGPSPERRALTLLDGTDVAPAFVAEAMLHEPVRASASTLAIVTDAVEATGSAWDVALAALREGDEAAFRSLAAALGGAACRMHRALAKDRSCAPLTNEGVQDRMSDALVALQVYVPEDRLLQMARRTVPEGPEAGLGAVFPVHGDLHLGQVLVRPDGSLRVIDFEGEPSRPAEERSAPDSPLRDVAGMLRSFDYAVATAALEGAHDRLRRLAETAFLDAYRAAVAALPSGAQALWPSGEAFGSLLRFYLAQKAAYEIAYERAFRPGWAWIPEAALARLVEGPDLPAATRR